jgi:hypothetical protein
MTEKFYTCRREPYTISAVMTRLLQGHLLLQHDWVRSDEAFPIAAYLQEVTMATQWGRASWVLPLGDTHRDLPANLLQRVGHRLACR